MEEDAAKNLIQLVQYQGAFALSGESALLDTLDGDLEALIPELFAANAARRSLVFRLLTTTALARGESRALELLALTLFQATQPSVWIELSRLHWSHETGGLRSVWWWRWAPTSSPSSPTSSTGSSAGSPPSARPSPPRAASPSAFSFHPITGQPHADGLSERWLANLVELAGWERQAAEGAAVLDLRLCQALGTAFGLWLPDAVAAALAGAPDEEGRLVVALVEIVGVPSPQLPRQLTNSLDAFGRLLFQLLASASRLPTRPFARR